MYTITAETVGDLDVRVNSYTLRRSIFFCAASVNLLSLWNQVKFFHSPYFTQFIDTKQSSRLDPSVILDRIDRAGTRPEFPESHLLSRSSGHLIAKMF